MKVGVVSRKSRRWGGVLASEVGVVVAVVVGVVVPVKEDEAEDMVVVVGTIHLGMVCWRCTDHPPVHRKKTMCPTAVLIARID